MKRKQQPLLITVPEAAELLGVSRNTVWNLIADRALPSLLIRRGARRIARSAIDDYIAQHTEGSPDHASTKA